MEKKNVKEVIKELIPVAVDIISDKLSSKEDAIDYNPLMVIDTDKDGDVYYVEDKDEICIVNDIHKLAVGLIKYRPINKIVDSMNERELTDEQKVKESYCNGFCDGFMLASDAHNKHLAFTYDELSNPSNTIETAKSIIEQGLELE